MFVYFYCILLVLITTHNNTTAKSLFNENSYAGQNEAPENAVDYGPSESPSSLDALKYKRVLLQNSYQPYDNSYPKNTADDSAESKNVDYRPARGNFPYGIVYNNGKPLGILEPLPRQYRTIKANSGNLQLNYKTEDGTPDILYSAGKTFSEDPPLDQIFRDSSQLANDVSPVQNDRGSHGMKRSRESKTLSGQLEKKQNKRETSITEEFRKEETKLPKKREAIEKVAEIKATSAAELSQEERDRQTAKIQENKDALMPNSQTQDDLEHLTALLNSKENAKSTDTHEEIRRRRKKEIQTETNGLDKRDSDCKNDKSQEKLNREHDKNDKSSSDVKEKSKKRFVSIDDKYIQQLKSTLKQLKDANSPERMNSVQRDLRDLLVEMGLAEKDETLSPKAGSPSKRSVSNEDENLEGKDNKIEITKVNADEDLERRKRHDQSKNENRYTRHAKIEKRHASCQGIEDIGNLKNSEKVTHKVINKKESGKRAVENSKASDENKPNLSEKPKAKRETQKFKGNRSKREDQTSDATEIMKNLEGDLTISGNKSPLASSGNVDTPLKQNTSPSALADGSNDKLSYQERIERNIQAKIDAIKEEVRKEIESLKGGDAPSVSLAEETSRKKRQTRLTLISAENPEINPDLNVEENLQPHIRRRRNIETTVGNHDKDVTIVNQDPKLSPSPQTMIVKREEKGINVKDDTATESLKRENKNNDDKNLQKRNMEDNPAKSVASSEANEVDSGKQMSNQKEKKEVKENDANSLEVGKELVTSKSNTNHGSVKVVNNDELRFKRNPLLEKKEVRNSNLNRDLRQLTEHKIKRQKREAYDFASRDDRPDMFHYRRRKRDPSYVPFREDEYEMDGDELDDFDDEGYYERGAARKRQADYDSYSSNKRKMQMQNGQINKQSDSYMGDFDTDIADNSPAPNYVTNYRYRRFAPRRRRQSEERELVNDEVRSKRETDLKNPEENEAPQQISDLSETDLFGALPQHYVGELARFKRVKRQKTS